MSVCRSIGLSVGLSVCPTLLLGLKLAKAKKRQRQSVSGNQREKEEEKDTKKEGNKRHQKKDYVHMKTVSPNQSQTSVFAVCKKFIIKVYQYANILVGKAVSVQTSQKTIICSSVSKFLK